MSRSAASWSAGHSVIVVPVPLAPVEEFVRARTAYYDASFVSADPDFAQAHVTVLGPWVPRPTAADLSRVAEVLGEIEPFELELGVVAEFPDGVIHLRAEPAPLLRELTAALHRAFPDHPPYGGQFGDDLTPHLTLDRRAPGITPESVGADLGDVLPLRHPVTHLDLQWWANDDCRVLHRWQLEGVRR
ncbi:2'-5' RNA ligase family protein [Nocardioides massiliensis]|uniref:2'-5' RNA ligase n=1 Tax=Nocardioides massiliensis TaxID=1325935 RepID=A0ABT9NU03_9ACTN|nr:2'-5' RNA ligase family protein [Nocardioides massiliensis]MDP9823916.1 2'-5' RNA ligase [Nocardioides massiliensis]